MRDPQRYNIYPDNTSLEIEEAKDGEWVKWEDVRHRYVPSEWTKARFVEDGGTRFVMPMPPCWLLIEDTLNPDRDPWPTYWDGTGWPINCTSYQIIGYYQTPLPTLPTRDISGSEDKNA